MMRTIIQIAPEISAGTGVGGVAHHLETEFRRMGVRTERFTLAEARGGWLPAPGPGVRGRLALSLRVLWFSTVGTVLARRRLSRLPDAVSICHNDALAGDIYVNHGVLLAAMRARGMYAWRMVRNPLHLFTTARDAVRFAGRTHRVVVNLTTTERTVLAATYPRVRPRSVVISNGVDTDRFSPASADERRIARESFRIPAAATTALFVGHEFDRKGLPLLVQSLVSLPTVHALVVGGTNDMLDRLKSLTDDLGVSDRVHLAGRMGDPRPAFHAADLLVLPSAYEANALVVLEAFAAGLPVITTPVGYAPDVVVDGQNGWLVERTVPGVSAALRKYLASDEAARERLRTLSRRTAERHTWALVAAEYLALVAGLEPTGR